jgi:hypothetical protein
LFEHTNMMGCSAAAGVHLSASACHLASAVLWLLHSALLLLLPLLLLPVLLLEVSWQLLLTP